MQVPHLDLALGPGHFKRPLHDARIAELIGELQRFFAACGKTSHERQAGRFVRREYADGRGD